MADLADLVGEAFIYGYPLVADLEEVVRFTQSGMGSVPAAGFNEFSHARSLAGPHDTFVTINNDTLYSIAQFDLSAGPLFLDVPDAAGRYYVLQFIDAWSNNFAYVGRRASGTDAATYLLTPPDWGGDVSEGMTVIEFPTRVASVLGRWACSGTDDLAAVHALQDELRLRPPGPPQAPVGIPRPAEGVDEPLLFFEKLRTWMAAFPPAPADRTYQHRFAPLGLLDRTSPYVHPPAPLAQALRDGLSAARAELEGFTRTGTVAKVNGWMLGTHLFDYNLDHFGPGTIDARQWKIADRESSYRMRALAARAGLWGNHAYEAAYAQIFEDDRGEQLTGACRYTVRFDMAPPVGAFWSLTMYDIPRFYLVDNPLARYSIGDRTPGLHYANDGSLTVAIQRDPPADPDQRANWLPAPPGDFRPVMRLYQPGQQIFDGTYQLPAIHRVD